MLHSILFFIWNISYLFLGVGMIYLSFIIGLHMYNNRIIHKEYMHQKKDTSTLKSKIENFIAKELDIETNKKTKDMVDDILKLFETKLKITNTLIKFPDILEISEIIYKKYPDAFKKCIIKNTNTNENYIDDNYQQLDEIEENRDRQDEIDRIERHYQKLEEERHNEEIRRYEERNAYKNESWYLLGYPSERAYTNAVFSRTYRR